METLDSLQLKIIDVIKKHHNTLWQNPHILGFGRGLKITNSYMSSIPCLTIFVKKKLPKSCLDSSQIISSSIDGVLTDIVESNTTLNHAGEIRPAVGGISVSNGYRKGGGTIAYAVYDANNRLYILSCGHVLCRDIDNINLKDEIIQPSPTKGGHLSTSSIALLDKWKPLKISKTPPDNFEDYNEFDAALALVNYNLPCNQRTLLSPRLIDGTVITGTTYVKPGDIVWKIGAATQKTHGRVMSVNTIYFVESTNGKAFFKDQIIVDMKSNFGDSGALGVYGSNKAFGMLIAGCKPNSTFFCPINPILDFFNVKLAVPLI